jgi:hypothetical protein
VISCQFFAEKLEAAETRDDLLPLPVEKTQFLDFLRTRHAAGLKWVSIDPGATRVLTIEASVLLKELGG